MEKKVISFILLVFLAINSIGSIMTIANTILDIVLKNIEEILLSAVDMINKIITKSSKIYDLIKINYVNEPNKKELWLDNYPDFLAQSYQKCTF